MTISRSRCWLTIGPGVLLLLITVPLRSGCQELCPQENILPNEVQSWPNNIIFYKMSSNLTDNVKREILKVIDGWEQQVYIVFIPTHYQEQELQHFVHFVPGERCCSDKGRVSQRRQRVYIHESCISDETLRDVVGTLIGVTPRAPQRRVNTNNHTNIHQEPNGNTCPQEGSHSTCINRITGKLNGRFKHGQIYSPNYPTEYPNNVEYVWKIRVPGNAVLELNLQDFDTECSHDFLEIHHLSPEGHINSLPRLCGEQSEHERIRSHLSMNTVLIRFHTDTTYNKKGFNISYQIIENKHECGVNNGNCSYRCDTDASGIGRCVCESGFRASRRGECKDINECKSDSHGCEQDCKNIPGSYQCFCNVGYALDADGKSCQGCREEINETEGEIVSQNWPGFYLDHQNCLYTILIHPKHILKLIFIVDIHPSNECKTEFLKVQHGYFSYNRRLCGYIGLSYYIKDGNATSTYLRFRTRNLNTVRDHRSSGFSVRFKQVLRSSVSDDEINQVVINNKDIIEYSNRPWVNFTNT